MNIIHTQLQRAREEIAIMQAKCITETFSIKRKTFTAAEFDRNMHYKVVLLAARRGEAEIVPAPEEKPAEYVMNPKGTYCTMNVMGVIVGLHQYLDENDNIQYQVSLYYI